MKCHLFQDELLEYLDGTLSGSAKLAVEAHLEQCAACRQTVQMHKALADRFRHETELLVLRPGLVDQIISATEVPPVLRCTGFRWSRLAWPTAIAAGFLVAVGVSLYWPFRARMPSREDSHTPALASISIRESYCDPTYTFRRDENQVVDTLICTPRDVEKNLSLTMNQSPVRQTQARKTPL